MEKKKLYATVAVILALAIGFVAGTFITGKTSITGKATADNLDQVAQQTAALATDSKQLQQLKGALGSVNKQPFATPLPEHQYKTLTDKEGNVVGATFLHYDKPVGQERNILYFGDAVPGKLCNSPEVQKLIKNGYVHFHTTNKVASPDLGHGGKGGEPGFWLRHVSTTTGQIDYNFMPTTPPECN